MLRFVIKENYPIQNLLNYSQGWGKFGLLWEGRIVHLGNAEAVAPDLLREC